jgi:hypothetical protein
MTVSRVIWLMLAHSGMGLAAVLGVAVLAADGPAAGLPDDPLPGDPLAEDPVPEDPLPEDPLPGAPTLPHPASRARPRASAASRQPVPGAGPFSKDVGYMATCFPGPLTCLPYLPGLP